MTSVIKFKLNKEKRFKMLDYVYVFFCVFCYILWVVFQALLVDWTIDFPSLKLKIVFLKSLSDSKLSTHWNSVNIISAFK